MSGFTGIINGNGQPVDATLLQQMTDVMKPQGQDAQRIWSHDHVGFGHALLRTTWESQTEQQPHSLGGDVWITGDIRLDRRSHLIEQLRGWGCQLANNCPDVDLVLSAFQVWGEACLDRLSGDFAFGIWDGRQQKLFCARDQFGVVPLYYAQLGKGLIFSNHLNSLRRHPQVSARLNDRAIGDFLLLGMNTDLTTTTFADIHKLPPAHQLVWRQGQVCQRQYWQLPQEVDYLRYKRPEAYVEQFRGVFERAIADRLRTDRAGTHLSGGMDSTSIAATAYRLMRSAHSSVDFRAYSIVYRQLLEEHEGDYAAQVADMAGFPLELLVAEDYIGQPPQASTHLWPEPLLIPNQVAEPEITRRTGTFSRVLLAGFGGDPAFFPSPAAPLDGSWPLIQALRHWGGRTYRRMRSHLRQRLKGAPPAQGFEFPDWFNPAFVDRIDLKARLQAQMAGSPQQDRYGMATAPLWSNIFAWSHPGFNGSPVKVRFPFFDVELILFLLSVPPTPWFNDKYLLREAMHGQLPDSVRLRPKTPLSGFAHYNLITQTGIPNWIIDLVSNPALGPYISEKILLNILEDIPAHGHTKYRQILPVLHLSYWLEQQQRANLNDAVFTTI